MNYFTENVFYKHTHSLFRYFIIRGFIKLLNDKGFDETHV